MAGPVSAASPLSPDFDYDSFSFLDFISRVAASVLSSGANAALDYDVQLPPLPLLPPPLPPPPPGLHHTISAPPPPLPEILIASSDPAESTAPAIEASSLWWSYVGQSGTSTGSGSVVADVLKEKEGEGVEETTEAKGTETETETETKVKVKVNEEAEANPNPTVVTVVEATPEALNVNAGVIVTTTTALTTTSRTTTGGVQGQRGCGCSYGIGINVVHPLGVVPFHLHLRPGHHYYTRARPYYLRLRQPPPWNPLSPEARVHPTPPAEPKPKPEPKPTPPEPVEATLSMNR
ncbi:hypothetical protein DXG01_008122 [Tephrocybe rancida]|nr:hypothetical protein DXG01_008122 [Tephrocybe rancida]